MNVSGTRRPREEMYTYNSIRLNSLRRQNVEVDAGTTKVDVTKAISDMAKDFVLQQYQYFVRTDTTNQNANVFRSGKKFAL